MYEIYLFVHVIGACVLLGTGSGIAFFMMMAHRTREAGFVAKTAQIVVVADAIFTATAVVLQPVSGLLLVQEIGWSFSEPWILISLGLYVFVGCFWLPVVWIQIQMRDLAIEASENEVDLPKKYFSYYRVWFLCGIPAFTTVLGIVWLMLTKPQF